MGELAVMSHEGDTKIIWDATKPDEVETARATFESLTKKGYWAYAVAGKNGEKGERIKKFDPEAEKIILAPQLVGG